MALKLRRFRPELPRSSRPTSARRLKERLTSLNWELFDRAVGAANWAALEELLKAGRAIKLDGRAPASGELAELREALDKPFAAKLLLWKKTKNDLVEEMSTALQMPGWGNSFTQPIANRIEMLSTGVRMPVAAKVFGTSLKDVQAASQEIAAVLREIPGAADVFPDQVVGKGYVEIKIDRAKAARYGINVGDVQDVVEVALGGKALTMTVERRERYPCESDTLVITATISTPSRTSSYPRVDRYQAPPPAWRAVCLHPRQVARPRPCRSRWPQSPTSRWWKGRR